MAARKDYAKKAPPPPKATPGWVWLLAGLLIGLFVAGLVWLKQNTHGHRSAHTTTVRAPTPEHRAEHRAAAPKPAPAKKSHSGVKFDFYKLLPEYEVPVPSNEQDTGSNTPPKPLPKGRYILQVGAFRKAREADAHKAQLALLGIVSNVQTVTVNGNETWHRVRIGPYSDPAQLDKIRALLKQHHVEYVVLQDRS